RFFFENSAARFKDQHVLEVVRQLDRQGNPGGATPDDRDTAANVDGITQLASIDDHREAGRDEIGGVWGGFDIFGSGRAWKRSSGLKSRISWMCRSAACRRSRSGFIAIVSG